MTFIMTSVTNQFKCNKGKLKRKLGTKTTCSKIIKYEKRHLNEQSTLKLFESDFFFLHKGHLNTLSLLFLYSGFNAIFMGLNIFQAINISTKTHFNYNNQCHKNICIKLKSYHFFCSAT